MWSFKIFQFIPELFVSGTPPSSIIAYIGYFAQNTATYFVIKELPSIWFILQCQTVLLTTCQLLSEYCLSKSDKWVTLQTDGIGRRHTEIINLIIKIDQANDPIFLPVLFSVSLLPEDEMMVGHHYAIVSFIREKKWLKKCKDVMTTEYPHFECDI